MPLVKVGCVGDMEENTVRSIEVDGEEIAIYFVCGRYYATVAICTHAYANLADGWVDEDRCEIECPLHGSAFNLETGKPRTLPATQAVRTYPVVVEGEDIFIDVSLPSILQCVVAGH